MFAFKVSFIILMHSLCFICAEKDYEYNRPSNSVDYTKGNEFVNVNEFSEVDNTGYDYAAPKQLKIQYDQVSSRKYNNNQAVNDPKTGESHDGYSVTGSYVYTAPKISKVQYNQIENNSLTKNNNNQAVNDPKTGETNGGYSVSGYVYTAPKQLKVQYDQTENNSPTKNNNNQAVNDPKSGDIKSHSESNEGYSMRSSYGYIAPKLTIVQYDQPKHFSANKYNNNQAENDTKAGDIKSQNESSDGYSVSGSYVYTAPKLSKVQYNQIENNSPTKNNNNQAVNDPKTGESNDGYSVSGYVYTAPKQLKVQYDQTDSYSPTKYNYNYAVNDPTTGDIKSHSESNDGYSVHGSYSLIDPDGFKRIVTYIADDLHGFNAIVRRVPYVLQTTSKPVPAVESRGPVTFVLNLMDSNDKHFEDASSQRLSKTAEIPESSTTQVQSVDSYATPPPLGNEGVGGPYA